MAIVLDGTTNTVTPLNGALGATTPSTVAATSVTASTGIVGTTTNNSAGTGYVGEYVSSTVSISSNSMTTATAKNITSISLTAGDWDVSGCIFLDGAVSTNMTLFRGNASSTSAAINFYTIGWAGFSWGTSGIIPFGAGAPSLPLPTQRFSLSTTTTIYLVGIVSFTVSTITAGGYITARRVR